MENKINIAEILKDCPKGMELDCSVWNNVVFDHIDTTSNYPIYIKKMGGELEYLTEDGHFNFDCDAKCVIFPKGKTTWEGFQRPFKDGDIVVGKNNACSYITIFKDFRDNTLFNNYVCLTSFGTFKVNNFSDNANLRFATEEEKQKLFKAIKDAGYKWNAETKTLEKLIKPKFKVGDKVKDKNNRVWFIVRVSETFFDISSIPVFNAQGYFVPMEDQDDYELVPNKFDITTLVPFESRVLVRDNEYCLWKPAIFGFYNKANFYMLGGSAWRQCIPYEGNEHLLGTTNDCDNYYKTW